MADSTHDVKDKIIAAIAALGGEPRQIHVARAMGPEWATEPLYSQLRQTMRRMADEYVLTVPRRGVYAVHPSFHRRGFDVRDFTVRQIEKFLTERCGVARTGEIHAAVGARDIQGGVRDAEHRRVTLALANTPEKFCQDFGPGIWALTAEVRERLPLLGAWADMELGPGERDDFFARVGDAFAEARGDRSVEDVTACPDIRAALHAMACAAPDAKRQYLGELRADVAGELAAAGIADAYAITTYCRERQEAELPIYIYLAFEAGDVRLHLAASPEFNRGVAAFFGTDAARLSRGAVAADVVKDQNFGSSAALVP